MENPFLKFANQSEIEEKQMLFKALYKYVITARVIRALESPGNQKSREVGKIFFLNKTDREQQKPPSHFNYSHKYSLESSTKQQMQKEYNQCIFDKYMFLKKIRKMTPLTREQSQAQEIVKRLTFSAVVPYTTLFLLTIIGIYKVINIGRWSHKMIYLVTGVSGFMTYNYLRFVCKFA